MRFGWRTETIDGPRVDVHTYEGDGHEYRVIVLHGELELVDAGID